MNWLEGLVLGVVQGLTEFLPISSTAHLRVVPHFLGWEDPGAAVSAVIQLGTLLAVFIYFAGDIGRLIVAALEGLRQRDLNCSPDTRMAWSIVPGTLPIAVLGFGFKDFIETEARSLYLIAGALIVLALLLLIGGVIGAQFGAMLGAKLRGEQLRILLGLIVLAVCARVAYSLVATPDDLFSLGRIGAGG